jgi:hypothetical protein
MAVCRLFYGIFGHLKYQRKSFEETTMLCIQDASPTPTILCKTYNFQLHVGESGLSLFCKGSHAYCDKFQGQLF